MKATWKTSQSQSRKIFTISLQKDSGPKRVVISERE